MDNEIRRKFNRYINDKAPNQLERLFVTLSENDGIMLQSCFEDFAKIVLEQGQETRPHETIVTLLHEEAGKLEKQGLTQGKIGNTHAMHEKIDTARCFRIAANTLSGDQAG